MNFLPILLLLLSTSQASSRSRARDQIHDDDIFEDALLEHLHDIRDVDGSEEEYFEDERDDAAEDNELTREELLKVLDVIKKEAHRRKLKLKKSIENEEDHEAQVGDRSKSNEINSKKQDSSSSIEKNKETKKVKRNNDHSVSSNKKKLLPPIKDKKKKRESSKTEIKNLNIETEKRGGEDNLVNNQVASVVPDDSVEKQNELVKSINLRDVLNKVTNLDSSTNTTTPKKPSHAHIKQEKVVSSKANKNGLDRVSFIAVVAGCCVAAIAGIALAAYCWYKLRLENKDESEYQQSSTKRSSGKKKGEPQDVKKPLSQDEKMVQNAEMYHYQHAKSQIQQMGAPTAKVEKYAGDDTTDDEDDEDTVYECPGLAAPGDMKVVNPLFSDGESHHSDKHSESTSHDGSPTPPNERLETVN